MSQAQTDPIAFSDSGTLAPGEIHVLPTQAGTIVASADVTLTDPGDLTPFIGTGVLDAYLASAAANGNATLTGSANLDNNTHLRTLGNADVEVIYTYHLAAPEANIQITPDALNVVGTEHTFTIAVTANPGEGSVSFNVPTVAFNQNPSSVGPVTLVGDTTNPDGTITRTWTETINSTTPGVFQATATDVVDFTFGGDTASTTVTTDGVGKDSGAAVKTYVDANIQISPAIATNKVGTAHTFTITVTALTAGTTPTFALPTIAFVGASPATVGPVTLVSEVGNVATYKFTINSAAPGTFVVNATDAVTFAGTGSLSVADTVTTNGAGSNSGPAVKIYTKTNPCPCPCPKPHPKPVCHPMPVCHPKPKHCPKVVAKTVAHKIG